ncbi:hypothetical protein [Leeia aquatica]|uniref:Uncharacterized protein n=1 Tax=Leeia aquatica TaxID=2725557 RepID=A0A847RUN7_9NEIS|nr:hypothetical protein [Leeia aquatica]NLR73551.1 hypothetical protein [Leeia aquatica]
MSSHNAPERTHVDPDAMDNMDELRAALHRANKQLHALEERLHAIHGSLSAVSAQLARLVIGHMQGHHDFVLRELDGIVKHQVMCVSKSPSEVH